MKQLSYLFTLLFVASIIFAACSQDEEQVAVSGVTLNYTEYELEVGETKQLEALVMPTDAYNRNVRWESSNPTVASVTDGLVKALTVGKTTITVTTLDGNKTATSEITVFEEIDFSKLILNEIGTQDAAIFIEIFNSGDVEIPLAGVTVSRNDGQTSWTGQEGDVIPAGAYRIILARNGNRDGQNDSNNPSDLQQLDEWVGWIMPGGISNSSTLKIALLCPDEEYIDLFIRAEAWDNNGEAWGNSLPNNGGRPAGMYRNYARMPNGTWAWAAATPGRTNGASVQAIANPRYWTAIP